VVILFIAITIVLLVLSWKYMFRLEPAGVFAVIWLVSAISVLLLNNYIELRYTGGVFMLTGVTVFVMGTIFSDAFYHPEPTGTGLELKKQWVGPALLVLIAGAMVNPIYSIILHGFSLQVLLDMREIMEMNKGIAGDRYSGSEVSNFVNQFFLIFSYAAPVIGGFCYRLVGRWNKALCIITLIPGTFIALTQSMKMGMITSFMLWLASYLVCSFSYGLPIRMKARAILRFALIIVGFFLILFLSMVLRTGEISEKTILEISEKFVAYSLGHMHCVDMWYTSYTPTDLAWGSKTFMGISNLLGIEERVQGLYPEYLNIGKNGFYGISNIYTCFRPLVEDFGEVGAIIIMFGMGVAANMSFKALKAHQYIFFNQMILVAIYGYVMWSFAASFYMYTSYLAMFVVVYVLFHLLQKETEPC